MNGQLCRWPEGAVSEQAWQNCRVHTRGYLVNTAGKGEFDAKALVKKSREYFSNFNIPEEIATDGGPQMMSDVFQKSLN
jgi:hypothetical protein